MLISCTLISVYSSSFSPMKIWLSLCYYYRVTSGLFDLVFLFTCLLDHTLRSLSDQLSLLGTIIGIQIRSDVLPCPPACSENFLQQQKVLDTIWSPWCYSLWLEKLSLKINCLQIDLFHPYLKLGCGFSRHCLKGMFRGIIAVLFQLACTISFYFIFIIADNWVHTFSKCKSILFY